MWAMSITGHSVSHCLPCPAPSWVPNIIGTWGGNSVKFYKCSDKFRMLAKLGGRAQNEHVGNSNTSSAASPHALKNKIFSHIIIAVFVFSVSR